MKTFKTTEFNNQLSRSLGKRSVNFAEVGECVALAERIEDGNLESWHNEWLGLAQSLHEQADTCKSKVHVVSTKNLYFRASRPD